MPRNMVPTSIALIACLIVALHASTARAACPPGETKTFGGTTINCYCDSAVSSCASGFSGFEGHFSGTSAECDASSTRTCYTDASCDTSVSCLGSCPSGAREWDTYTNTQVRVLVAGIAPCKRAMQTPCNATPCITIVSYSHAPAPLLADVCVRGGGLHGADGQRRVLLHERDRGSPRVLRRLLVHLAPGLVQHRANLPLATRAAASAAVPAVASAAAALGRHPHRRIAAPALAAGRCRAGGRAVAVRRGSLGAQLTGGGYLG
jgi:hypothetical protein